MFEPNPRAIAECKKNIAGDERIKLVEAAASDQSGTIEFFPVVESYQPGGVQTDNFGASSLLRASGLYGETYIQESITVQSIRADDFCRSNDINSISLLLMDVQGAEVSVLQGFGDYLYRIKYIITEATIVNQYSGQAQLHHINDFLVKNGFRLVSVDMENYWGFGNFLYINSVIEVPLVGSN